MKINEIPSGIWNYVSYLDKPINRSLMSVSDYLDGQGVTWVFGDSPDAEFRVYKEENIRNGLLTSRRLINEYQKRFSKCVYLNMNGEAQENSRLSYCIADPKKTLAVAPGDKFKRAYFPTTWEDPQIDTWDERLDKICIIGRPLPSRLRYAEMMRLLEIPFDVYGTEHWDIPEYKGIAPDEREVARKYKYRLVMENSLKDKYHSEKLINSLMAGCVTFYVSDPELVTPLEGSYLACTDWMLLNREEFAKEKLERMKHILFGNIWEEYSFKSFFDRIIQELKIISDSSQEKKNYV